MGYKLLLVSAVLFSSFFVSAQDDLDSEKEDGGNNVAKNENAAYEVGAIKLRDNFYMLKGKGGNIGVLLGDDGIFMIDDQFAESSPRILQRLRTISDKPIELLVNTHHHGDHVGGNKNMADLGTVIFSHENARRRMALPYLNAAQEVHQKKMDSLLSKYGSKTGDSEENQKTAYREVEKIVGTVEDQLALPEGMLPVVSFPKDITFNYNGEKIFVLHLPNAHTDGDVMLYFTKSNVLHTGDAFFNGSYPFIDTESYGSLDGCMTALQRMTSMINEDTKIIPGHGNVANIEDLKYTIRMFDYLTNKIAYQVVDNKTLEQVLAMQLTKEYDDKGYGDGFITTDSFVATLYKELQKKYRKK